MTRLRSDKHRERVREWYHRNKVRISATRKLARMENPTQATTTQRKAHRMEQLRLFGVDRLTMPRWCQNCGRPSPSLCMDHDHETGKFRGWLCRKCNAAIGMLGDNIEGLESALRYLRNTVSNTIEATQ